MLSFFGRGSGFSDVHNGAFFRIGHDIVLMDCPMISFTKLKNMKDADFEHIYVAVTHTHSDHIAGLALTIHYATFVWKKKVTVIAPSEEVRKELEFLLGEMDGCSKETYSTVTADEAVGEKVGIGAGLEGSLKAGAEDAAEAVKNELCWLQGVIPTVHVPALDGKCFGYRLTVEGKNVIYTGDTATLEPFIPYIQPGSVLYTECSAIESGVHLYIDRLLKYEDFFKKNDVTVYLMHLDDEKSIVKKIKGTGLQLAPLYVEQDIRSADTTGVDMMDKGLLDNIYDISARLYSEMCSDKEKDHKAIFEYMTELGRTMADADRASFWKWDRHKKQLWTTSATGVDRIVIPDNTGLVGKALKSGKVVVTNDPYNDPDFNKAVDIKTGYRTKSVLVMPVADINGEFIGAFQIINKNGDGGFDEKEDVRRLSMAALICGLAVESESFFEESHHDKLTKLKNRMGFYSDFSRIFSKVLSEGRKLSLFICDIDKFKRVNDTYGHNAGDDVLAFVASILEASCKDKEAVYRWGGEEFIMMMPDTDLLQSVAKAEEIRKRIMESSINADGNVISVTMSFGCRLFDENLSIEDNISKADEHLYTAKESGRNCVIY